MSKMKHQLELRIERLAYDLADWHGHFHRLRQYEEKLWAIWSRNPDKFELIEQNMQKEA